MTVPDRQLELALHVRAAQRLITGERGITTAVAIYVGVVAAWAHRRLRGETDLDLEEVISSDRLYVAAAEALRRDIQVQCKSKVEDDWDAITSQAQRDAELAAVTGWVGPDLNEWAHQAAAMAYLIDAQADLPDVVIGGGLARCWVTDDPGDTLPAVVASDPVLVAATREVTVDRLLYTRAFLGQAWDEVLSLVPGIIAHVTGVEQEEGAR